MITVKNRQRRFPVSEELVRRLVAKLVELVGYKGFEVGVWITTNKTIRRFNAQYRHKDKPTDILSFPFYPDVKPGKVLKVGDDEEKNLGDIIISAEYLARDARELGVTFDERLRVLLVHGICHLVGYDHETDEQFVEMAKKEQELLRQVLN